VLISYKNKRLEKQLTDSRELVKSYGQLARKINQRLADLKAAESLAVMRTLPAAGCHELSGERKGQLSITISVNYRLIFESDHIPLPLKADGGLDWQSVSSIRIIGIEDYH
jgi:plasmid maintenance system killer protein